MMLDTLYRNLMEVGQGGVAVIWQIVPQIGENQHLRETFHQNINNDRETSGK